MMARSGRHRRMAGGRVAGSGVAGGVNGGRVAGGVNGGRVAGSGVGGGGGVAPAGVRPGEAGRRRGRNCDRGGGGGGGGIR